jgi:peroxiredoxin
MQPMPALRTLCIALSIAGLSTGCIPGSAVTTSSSAQAPDFNLRALDGSTVRLSSHLGKDVVMLSFWATWCAPCLGEMPALQALHEAYKGQGFTLLSVSMDGPESLANVETIARRYGLTYPVLLDEDTRVAAVYNPTRDAPFAVLIGRNGQIVERRVGYSPGDEKALDEKIRAMVAEPGQGATK